MATYSYDAFGNITSQAGNLTNPYTYTGREYDPESGLYYYRARYYDPTIGRFLQPDPLDMATIILIRQYFRGSPISGVLYHFSLSNPPASSNVYLHVQNNPLNWVDPFGLLVARVNMPDYYSGNLNIGITNPWTQKWVGWSGQVVLDRYGNVYLGPLGGNAGKTLWYPVSGSITAGWLDWLNDRGKPSEQRLKEFLTAHSLNIGGGYWGGIGLTGWPGRGNAIEIGFVTPQVGISYHYSWCMKNLGIEW